MVLIPIMVLVYLSDGFRNLFGTDVFCIALLVLGIIQMPSTLYFFVVLVECWAFLSFSESQHISKNKEKYRSILINNIQDRIAGHTIETFKDKNNGVLVAVQIKNLMDDFKNIKFRIKELLFGSFTFFCAENSVRRIMGKYHPSPKMSVFEDKFLDFSMNVIKESKVEDIHDKNWDKDTIRFFDEIINKHGGSVVFLVMERVDQEISNFRTKEGDSFTSKYSAFYPHKSDFLI